MANISLSEKDLLLDGSTLDTSTRSDTSTRADLSRPGTSSNTGRSGGSGSSDTSTRDGYTPISERDNGFTGERQGSSDSDTNPVPGPGDRGYSGDSNSDGSRTPVTGSSGNYVFESMPTWQPNPDLSPEENIYGLQSYLSSLLSNVLSYGAGRGVNSLYNYRATLELMYDAINKSRTLGGLSDEASIQLAEKVADQMFSYINAQFQSALSYQSWYLQQEYNSPVNQITRLAQAGLNSSFVFGGLSSGNAQSSAQVPQIAQPANSNAGQVEAQAQANKQNFISSMIANGLSLASLGVTGYKTLLEADAIKKLTPLQIANEGLQVLNNAATYERLITENEERKQGMTVQAQQLELQKSQALVDSSKSDVDITKADLDQFWDKHKLQFQDTVFSTKVTDKYGNKVYKSYDQDALDFIVSHYGRDKEGNQVIDSSFFNKKGQFENKTGAKVSIPGVADVGSEFYYGLTLEHQSNHSDQKTTEKEKGHSQSSNNQNSHQEGVDDTHGWKIGNTEFKQEIRTRYLMPNEFKNEYQRLQDTYDRALRTYNSRSYNHKQMILRLDHCQTQNYGRMSEYNVIDAAHRTVRRILGPSMFQGD